ncbi:MAG: DinB family protein [Gemmatimonadota bacterium]|jgi:hypothetical protein
MGTFGQDFAILFGRELDHLAEEVAAYRSDADLWSTMGAQKNPPGTLALHTAGGLMAMIGTALGGTGYVRDRDREFSERDVSRDEVVSRVRECRDTIVPILAGLDDATLAAPHPGRVPPHMQGVTTHAFLLHLLWHVGWHLGHIYYHRLGLAGGGPV